MSYRFLAPFYDWVAPYFSRYRSPGLLTSSVLGLAPDRCDLLDIGVGTGLSIAAYVGSPRFKRIVGIDPSAQMLDQCRRKFPGIELYQGTLETVQPQLNALFDIIQSCGAVEHIADLTAFVERVSTSLKTGGYLIFTYEPEVLFTTRQSSSALHIGTVGREPVFRRKPHEVYTALANYRLDVCEDIEFKAYLGLVHHLVIARKQVTAPEDRRDMAGLTNSLR